MGCGAFVSLTEEISAIKSEGKNFTPEIPLDQILSQIIERQNLGRLYNPSASFLNKRRLIVDWMCELGEDLKF